MTRLVALVAVSVLAPAMFGQTQERHNYSGTWTLVEERSATSAAPRLGKEFKITQSPTTVSLETTVTVTTGSVPAGGGVMVTERKEMKISVDYITDGAEHEETLPSSMPGVGPAAPGAVVSSPAPGIYRATWMTGQLLILKYNKLPNENNALLSVSRLALSLDADGSLIVDNLNVQMRPRPNGPKQEPPVSVRTVYKKVQ
jgi:hypothetical protein